MLNDIISGQKIIHDKKLGMIATQRRPLYESIDPLGTLLLSWINLNISMDK